MSLKKVFVTGAAALTLCDAAAQQPGQAEAPKEIAVVEVKANAETMRRNETASKIVVLREEILKYGDPSILDVMKRLPGVTVTDNAVRMRGLGSGYTQVLVNGDRAPAGFSLDSLAPDMVERVEVIRAATAELSSQSIAGTINVILRKSATKRTREIKASVGGGAGMRSQGVNAAMSDKVGTYSYTLGVALTHSDIPSTSERTTVQRELPQATGQSYKTSNDNRNISKRVNLNSRLNWQRDGGDSVTWQTFLNYGRGGPSTSQQDTVTYTLPEYIYPELHVRAQIDNAILRSDVNWTSLFGGRRRLENKFGIFLTEENRSMDRLGMSAAGVPNLARTYATEVGDHGATWTGKFSMPVGEQHAISAGWDAGHNKYKESERQDESIFISAPFNFANAYGATVDRMAFYAQDEWEPGGGWSIYLGARWEGVRTVTTGQEFGKLSSRLSVLSPVIQTVWKIPGAKSDQLRLALTRTYKAPELSTLVPRHFYASFNTAVTPDTTGNPGLKPELAVGLDLAYEHYLKGGGLLSASVTARNIEDFVYSEVHLVDGRWILSPRNQGSAQVRGIDLEAKLPLTSLWTGARKGIDLRASIGRYWSTVDSVRGPHNRLDRQPPLTSNLGIDYKGAVVSAGAAFGYVAGGWTRTSHAESAYASTRRDLEAYVEYKLTPRSRLRATVRNIMNTDAASESVYINGPLYQQTYNYRPGYAGWRWQYEHNL